MNIYFIIYAKTFFWVLAIFAQADPAFRPSPTAIAIYSKNGSKGELQQAAGRILYGSLEDQERIDARSRGVVKFFASIPCDHVIVILNSRKIEKKFGNSLDSIVALSNSDHTMIFVRGNKTTCEKHIDVSDILEPVPKVVIPSGKGEK